MDADTRLPIVDLGSAKLGAEDVRDLDAIVFDLQDPGVRFFTVMGRLQQCMETAADAGIEFVVLDRPNPLGGDLVEGPTREAGPTVRAVLTNLAPGPLVHGLTTGEMAQLIRSRLGKPLRLTVVPMKGWKRGMTWTDTGRPWPSIAPNLRSPEAALVYPGLGLLEATNVSEGRGTDQPFLLFGAPWLEQGKLPSVSGSGFAIEPARFTPRASAFAVNPKHKDAECVGARVSVRDAEGAHPYEFGIQLLRFLTDQRGFAWTGPTPSTIWWARHGCARPWTRGRARRRSWPRTRLRSRSSARTARSSCSTDEAAVAGTDRERHESRAGVAEGCSGATHPDRHETRQAIPPARGRRKPWLPSFRKSFPAATSLVEYRQSYPDHIERRDHAAPSGSSGTARSGDSPVGTRRSITRADHGRRDRDGGADRRGQLERLRERRAGRVEQLARRVGRAAAPATATAPPSVASRGLRRLGRDAVPERASAHRAAVDGGADAAEDRDAERAAELGAGLGDRRRGAGPLGRRAADDQVGRQDDDRREPSE